MRSIRKNLTHLTLAAGLLALLRLMATGPYLDAITIVGVVVDDGVPF